MLKMPKTLQQFLLEELKDHPERIDLVMVMSNLATIGKLLSSQTNRAGLANIRGLSDTENVHDETQAKLDLYANDLCKSYLESTGSFAALASEEEEQVIDLHSPDAKYIIAFDPLDGSSNIDVNVSVGTIFSVHAKRDDVPAGDEQQFFQLGKDQALAGYILYGSSTILVFSWGEGVHEFTLDVDLGEFLLSDAHMKIPEACTYYSVNESYVASMAEKDQKYVAVLREKTTKQRWIGSFVADFHRNLIKGGVFFSPPVDTSGQQQFKPKLRLNYELKPLAFLVEQAGGSAMAGDERILEIMPHELHQRASATLGNVEIVTLYKES
ncbi:MAG TPA: class 1 fructose-bisphosphatase [Candidatus Saccharimonadia bacterium]